MKTLSMHEATVSENVHRCDLVGWNCNDHLNAWFGDCEDSHGVITFTKRLAHGGFDIVATFKPSDIEAAAKFVDGFEDSESLFLKTSLFNLELLEARRSQLRQQRPRGPVYIAGMKSEVKTIVGFAMDLDAGKSESYASQQVVWDALHDMPVFPTMLTLSGHADHGFHAWYKLDSPITIKSPERYAEIRSIVSAWRELLCDKIADRLIDEGVEDFKKEKLVDSTFAPDRVLRPVGAVRKSGAVVKFAWYGEDRYSLKQLTVPGYKKPKPRTDAKTARKEDSVISKFFAMKEEGGDPITIDGLLIENGYEHLGGDDWRRPESATGGRSVSEGDVINGLPGVNVFSGSCSPLKCSDDERDVGRRYNLYALFVAFNFGDPDDEKNWKAAAEHCHNAMKPTPEEAFAGVDPESPDWLAVESLRSENYLATRLVDLYGQDIRYVAAWRKWLVWDGKRFKLDPSGANVLRLARKLGKNLWNDLAAIGQGGEARSQELKAAIAFCKAGNKKSTIQAIVELAKADDRVAIEPDELNANSSLLNLQNGTLDLRTGEFRDHDRRDLLTQLASVAFEPEAECPQWEDTLQRVFAGDQELTEYVQKIFGYSLCGDAGEAILPIAYGSGCNGKSTIWNAVLAIAGEYGTLANESLLLGSKDGHETEKAQLYQKRIVAVSEPERGVAFRESRVKELTGDSFINCRRMFEDHWTFRRTHTFWLATNHRPRIKGTDEGIWRRLKLIPFTVDLRKLGGFKLVTNFADVLANTEGPGILNWVLDGYAGYLRDGLPTPEVVANAVDDYRNDEDRIGRFVSECCEVDDDFSGPARSIYEAYKRWGGKWSETAFGKEFSARFEKKKTNRGAVYLRVRLCEEIP